MCTVRILPACVRACGEPDWGAGGGPCAHSAYPPCVCTERVASLTGELEEARVPHSAYPPCVCAERVASLTGELEEARVLTVRILPACVQSVWRA